MLDERRNSVDEPGLGRLWGTWGFLRDGKFWWAILVAPLFWVAILALPGTQSWFEAALFSDGASLRGLLDTAHVVLAPHRLTLALVILCYPLLEEFVFRGALQGWLLESAALRRSWHGLTPANILTSVIFSGMHMFQHTLLAASLVFLPSLVFGWSREKYGGLQAPVILHSFYNAGYFTLLASWS